MKIRNTNQIPFLIAAIALIAALAWDARAATNIVLNSDNLQQDINNAAPGDTMVLQPGTYSANIIITNPLIFVRGIDPSVSNEPVYLGGTVLIQGNGASTFQQIYFVNTVTIQVTNLQSQAVVSLIACEFNQSVTSSGASLLIQSNLFQNSMAVDISEGSQTNLQAYDTTFNTLTINGGKALLKRCVFVGSYAYGPNGWYSASIGLNNTVFEGIRLSLNGITGTAATNTPFTIFQSTNGSGFEAPWQLSGYNVWMGDNNIYGQLWLHNCNTVLVGNLVQENNQSGGIFSECLQCDGGGTLQAYNNVFSALNNYGYAVVLSLGTSGGYAILDNNSINQNQNYNALYCDNAFPVTLLADAFYGRVFGASALWNISYCVFNQSPTVGTPPGGFGSILNTNANWLSPSDTPLTTNSFLLGPGSPCISNGPPQLVYNNAGTTNRNDIGYTGGPYYNPTNFTNTGPTIYMLTGWPLMETGAPLIFPQGRTNILTLNAAGVAGN